jgi:tetratricopeptide (TPR) repeat protein
VGKKTKISGQAGAVGDNAHVHDNTFNQTVKAEKVKVKKQVQKKRNVAIDGNVNDSNIITGDGNTVTIVKKPKKTYTALHQLPRPSADFVGREKEMAELLQALETGGVTISGLQGMGGIGKTALALKLADQLKPKYPDAQFYLNLKGGREQPVSVNDAMAHVIRSFHPEVKLPDNENSLHGLYNSLLNGKKALFLMDNAANREQVLPLIPPHGSIMLITSRNHIALSGFFLRRLDTLEPEQAKQLLLNITPRIGDCAEKIAELCGYLPLALEVAARGLNKAINLTPDSYVQRLSKATKQLELVEASLSVSYKLLSDELKTLWCSLSVFPNTFDDAAVAAVWKLSVEDAQDRLTELISYSLIEWNEMNRRYRLHDLVRLFADSRLDEQKRHAGKKLQATYFRDVLVQTTELYKEGGDSILSGLALFDLERENIEAGHSWAASLIGKDKDATHLIKDYTLTGIHIVNLRLPLPERIIWLEQTLNATRLLKLKERECSALGNLGNAYSESGMHQKAIKLFQKQIILARKYSSRQGEGNAFGSLGAVYLELDQPQEAIEFNLQYLKITQELGDHEGEGMALGNLGICYYDLGEYQKSIEFHKQSLLVFRKWGNYSGEARELRNLGNVYWKLGEVSKAIKCYEETLIILDKIKVSAMDVLATLAAWKSEAS